MLYTNALMVCLHEVGNLGLQPTPAQLAEVLNDHENFVEEINKCYAASDDVGLDTWARDMLFDLIGNHFVGVPSPTYGDGREYGKRFFENLHIAAEQVGWETVRTREPA